LNLGPFDLEPLTLVTEVSRYPNYTLTAARREDINPAGDGDTLTTGRIEGINPAGVGH